MCLTTTSVDGSMNQMSFDCVDAATIMLESPPVHVATLVVPRSML